MADQNLYHIYVIYSKRNKSMFVTFPYRENYCASSVKQELRKRCVQEFEDDLASYAPCVEAPCQDWTIENKHTYINIVGHKRITL